MPVVEEVIEPAPVKACPDAGRRIGEEISERLDYEPARFLRRRIARPKYVLLGAVDAVPIVAVPPDSLLERSVATPGLLAQMVVSRYCDHLPLYRQESIYWTPTKCAARANDGRMGRACGGMAQARLPRDQTRRAKLGQCGGG